MLLYLARWINQDFGISVMHEMGLEEEEIQQNKIVAVYSSFDDTRVTNFNYALFNTLKYANDEGILQKAYELLSQLAIEGLGLGLDSADIILGRASTDDVLAVNNRIMEDIRRERARIRGRTLVFKNEVVAELLSNIVSTDDVRIYLDSLSEYQRVRNGALFFDVLLTMFLAAGIRHVFVFLDQIEYVIRSGTRAKLSRETSRYRDLALEIQPSADATVFVITLHPAAGERIAQVWREARLPDFDYTSPINEGCIVILDELSMEEGKELVKTYLNDAHFRVEDFTGDDLFFPFTEEAVEELVERTKFHPGWIIRNAFLLVDRASERNIPNIDADFVRTNLPE